MMNKLTLNSNITRYGIAAASIVALAAFMLVAPVGAHLNPDNCTGNSVTLDLTVYRADETTVIIGGPTVESGETIKYRAILSQAGTNCNFEGGVLSIVTPDGVSHEMTNPVPLVSSGSPHVTDFQSYVVSESDVDSGELHAEAKYTGGESHTGPSHDNAQAAVERSVPYQDVALEVTKTAEPSLTEKFDWTIKKTVTPETWNLFDGDTGASEYTITLTKTDPTVSDHAVTGTITITNPAQFADAEIDTVVDELDDGTVAVVDCGGVTTVPAGGFIECSYTADPSDDSSTLNTATVTTSGDVDGDSGSAVVDWNNADIIVVNDEVTVDDTVDAGDAGPFSDSASYSYTRTFACGADEGTHDNTATIVETGVNDSASVTVNCYDLTVEKTADTTFDRDWDWTIDKSADQSNLDLDEGNTATVNYDVTVNAASTDSNHAVSGNITIMNNHPVFPAHLVSVTDILSSSGTAVVDCGGTTTVAAASSLVCTYSMNTTDGSEELNTATVVQQNHDVDSEGTAIPGGTTDYSGDAAVNYGDPANETDECIDVSDTNVGVLGTVCAGDAPETFQYEVSFGTDGTGADVIVECGENIHENIADFVTNDNSETGSDNWSVLVNVTCGELAGCTPGYWKNHPDVWEGYAPGELFGDVFGTGPSITLLEAANLKGGKENALIRHAVSALLNTTHPDGNYPLSEGEIFAQVSTALNSGDKNEIESLKNQLDEWNNLGCFIDAHGNPVDGE